MKIDLQNVVEQALGGLIVVAAISIVGWLGLSLSKSGIERSRALLVIVVILLAVITLLVKTVRQWFGGLGARIIGLARRGLRYWREILSLTSFVAICLLVFFVYRDLRAVGLMVAYTAFLIFSFMIWTQSHTPAIGHPNGTTYLVLPLEQIGNTYVDNRYRKFSLGKKQFGEVPFFIKAGRSIFDTSAITSEEFGPVELKLDEPVGQVMSIYLLINAGGAWKRDKSSGTIFEGMTIGSIQPFFDDGSSQKKTKLVLGKNVREWAPGNFPGELIDEVSDQLCKEVWKGENDSGNEAVIDLLEIPIARRNRNKRLERIVIVPEIKPGSPASEGGNVGFFILAITLELRS